MGSQPQAYVIGIHLADLILQSGWRHKPWSHNAARLVWVQVPVCSLERTGAEEGDVSVCLSLTTAATTDCGPCGLACVWACHSV